MQMHEMMYEDSPPRWVGKTVDGHMRTVSERIAMENFTEQYLHKLSSAANQFFPIPIGRRTCDAAQLPRDFPSIPPTCLTTQQGKDQCCVGFGLAAAMAAFGDRNWSVLRDLALAAVEAVGVEGAYVDKRGTPSKRWQEIEYYKAHFATQLRSTYEVFSPSLSSFDTSAMMQHDIAVCQVRSFTALVHRPCPLSALLYLTAALRVLLQLVAAPTGFTGHSVSIYNGRIYDAAEKASMPLTQDFLDRCVRENKHDLGTFNKFADVLLLRPKANLVNARNRLLKRPSECISERSGVGRKKKLGDK